MLPFEDRYSRQRRVPEIGADGQRHLQGTRWEVTPHEGVAFELEYLRRAGAEDIREVEGPALPFVWAAHFSHSATRALARGAWSALTRMRLALGMTATGADHSDLCRPGSPGQTTPVAPPTVPPRLDTARD